MQIKSTNKRKFYYYGYMDDKYAGFPFRLVVHFSRGRTVILPPKKTISEDEGEDIDAFIEKLEG